MEPVKLDDLQWKSLVNSIRDERCVLFIGPMLAAIREVYTEDDDRNIIQLDTPAERRQWSPIYFQLALHLANLLKQYNVDYDVNHQTDLEYVAQRFLKIDRMAEIDLKGIADEFIAQNSVAVPEVYELIKSLPHQFSLIVNTSPDTYLHRIFDRRKHQFEWYNYEESRDPEIGNFSGDYPLIYNWIGKVGEIKSLVLTEGQQLTFVKKIIQNDPKVPDKIVHKLNPKNAITYLFLGFNFERWQFRMLLDRLNISDQSKTIAPQHPWLFQQRRTAEFYISRFNFLFVEDHVEQFLQTLREKLENGPDRPNIPAANPAGNDLSQLYVSYHDKDAGISDKLLQMLKLLEKNSGVRIWNRGMTALGDNNLEEVRKRLRQSRYLMILVSADYMSADEDEIIQTERQFSIAGEWQDDKVIIPVLARPYPLDDPDFARLTVLPRNGRPLDDQTWGSIDRGILEVYQELKELLQLSSNQRNP